MRPLIFGVLLTLALPSQAKLTSSSIESLDKVIDVVLDLVRVDAGLKQLFGSVQVPEDLTESGIHFHNLTLTNVLSLYRDGESFIEQDEDKLFTNTTFKVENLLINLCWTVEKWMVILDGTAQLTLDSISINTVIGVGGLKVTLMHIDVPEIGEIDVRGITGTSVFFNGMVRAVVEKIINMDSMKKMITDQVVDSVRGIFSKIFK